MTWSLLPEIACNSPSRVAGQLTQEQSSRVATFSVPAIIIHLITTSPVVHLFHVSSFHLLKLVSSLPEWMRVYVTYLQVMILKRCITTIAMSAQVVTYRQPGCTRPSRWCAPQPRSSPPEAGTRAPGNKHNWWRGEVGTSKMVAARSGVQGHLLTQARQRHGNR